LLKVTAITEQLGDSLSASVADILTFDEVAISFGMIGALLAGVLLGGLVLFADLVEARRRTLREQQQHAKVVAARGRMTLPPKCAWPLSKGHRYCAFLSHYKVEAGSDARYLSDFMQRMGGAPAYLDSNNLIDLRTLFSEGVHKSDVIVLLATKHVLTRPWCILELWETHRHNVPLILFPVVGKGWSAEWSSDFIDHIEERLDEISGAGSLQSVMGHLAEQGVRDVGTLQYALRSVLGLDNEKKVREDAHQLMEASCCIPERPTPSMEESARSAFDEFDAAGDGEIDRQELKELCARLGKPLSVDQLDQAMRKLDKDRSGLIDVDEFMWWYKQGLRDAVFGEEVPMLEWQPWGSDNQICAAVVGLFDKIAEMTGKAIQWDDPYRDALKIAQRQRKKMPTLKRLVSLSASFARGRGRGLDRAAPSQKMLIVHDSDATGTSAARALQPLLEACLNDSHQDAMRKYRGSGMHKTAKNNTALGEPASPGAGSEHEKEAWEAWLGSHDSTLATSEVGEASLVVLVQTGGVLLDASVLLRLYEADRVDLPIMCVLVRAARSKGLSWQRCAAVCPPAASRGTPQGSQLL